MVKIYLP